MSLRTGFEIGSNPWDHGFSLYKFWGVAFVYMYFQLPLMVLIITPGYLRGLTWSSWREAASKTSATLTMALLASRWFAEVLASLVLGGMFPLFGSGFSAYATAEALTAGTIAITPIQIGDILNGNGLANQGNTGHAIGCQIAVRLIFWLDMQ